MSNSKENNTDKINQSNEEKEELLRKLSENLDIGNEIKNTNNKDNQSKNSMPTMPETIEISCIEPSNLQREKFIKNNNDNTIINMFGDDDDNLVSFYGEGGDLEKLVKTLDINKNNNEAEGYLTAFNITKVENEHLAKFTQSIGQKELLACKKVIDKVEFDGKMVTKVNDIKYLYMKSKDISNDVMDKILNNKEYSNDLFAWRDIFPGEDSFFRAVMFSYIENLILNNDFEEYKCFLFYLGTNIAEKYFSRILSYYQIDITRARISLALIYYAFNAGSSEGYIEKALSLFMKTYNMDMNFDLLLILNLKYLIYKYIMSNERKFYSKECKVKIGDLLPSKFIKNGNYLFKEFYETNLLQLNKGVDKISVSVIPFILRKNLYIYSFDKNKISHNFVYADNKQNKEVLPIRIVDLNGNYDIIYEKKYYTKFIRIFSVYSNIPIDSINGKNEGETKKEGVLRNQNNKANDIDRQNLNFLNITNDDFEKTIINNYNNQHALNNKINAQNQHINSNANDQKNIKNNINNDNIMNRFNSKTAMNNNINNNNLDNQNNINLNNSNHHKNSIANRPGQKNINNNQMNNNGYMNNHNNINNNNNLMNNNINNKMNTMYNMNPNMINNMLNNMNSGNLNNNNNNNTQNFNNMTNNYTIMNNNLNINLANSNLNNNQMNSNDNLNPKTDRGRKANIVNNQFDNNTNVNYNNQMLMNSVTPSVYMSQSLAKQCPQCKKPNKDNFYCDQCFLNHLISYAKNNYIEFLKENINNSLTQKKLKAFDEYLLNINVIFPNGASKSFNESYYLLSNPNKNNFNEHLDKFKTSICLQCKKFIEKDKGEFLNNTYLRFPCGCIFCGINCLNIYLNTVPYKLMSSFQCICGVKYEYIQLKYLLFFSISFDFKNLKKEIMRFMYEIIKTRCCKCKKDKEKLSKDKISVSVMELLDHEGGKIFDIHKFHHLICDKCKNNFDFNKNKFYCNLCVSEHVIIKKPDSQGIQMNDTCSII